jgi:hypothetical protein
MGINFIPIKTEQALFDLKVSWTKPIPIGITPTKAKVN